MMVNDALLPVLVPLLTLVPFPALALVLLAPVPGSELLVLVLVVVVVLEDEPFAVAGSDFLLEAIWLRADGLTAPVWVVFCVWLPAPALLLPPVPWVLLLAPRVLGLVFFVLFVLVSDKPTDAPEPV